MTIVSKFMETPRTHHQNTIIHTLKYPEITLRSGMLYRNNGHLETNGYIGAS